METKVTTAQVRAVRVYTNGCVLTCEGETHVEQGVSTVLVDCLGRETAEESIRVRVPASVSLLSVSVTHHIETEVDAEKRVKACQRAVERVQARIDNRNRQKDLWMAQVTGEDARQRPIEGVEEFLARLPERLDALDDELFELREELDAANRELQGARNGLNAVRSRRDRGLLCLKIDARQAMAMRFEVEARSNSAGWSSVYDIHVDGFDEPVRLRLRANVWQRTGQSWKGVKLTLSPAAPVERKGLPKLSPRRLRKRAERILPPPPGASMGSARMSAPRAKHDTLIPNDEVDYLEPMVEAQPPESQAHDCVNSVEYAVPGTWDVSGGGEAAVVEVRTSEIPARYRWRAVPLIDDSVYITAVLEEQLAPEAAGEKASVYLEGEYCGSVTLDVPDGDHAQEISLGADARMRTSRRLVNRRAGKTLLRGRHTKEESYELVVRSQRAEPTSVVLLDQVPLSEDKDIVVEVTENGGALLDTDNGELRWELELGANESAIRKFSYTVAHPKDVRLDERRDQPTGDGNMICPVCGALMEAGSAFCIRCGIPMRY